MSACLSELFHELGGFVCGKACVGVFSIPNSPLFYPHNHNQPITTNLTTNISITASTNLAIIFTPTPYTTPTTMKPLNIAYNKTLYINNTIIPLH